MSTAEECTCVQRVQIQFYDRIRVKKTRAGGRNYTYYYVVVPIAFKDRLKPGEIVKVTIEKVEM